MGRVGKGGRLEVRRQAHMQHIGGFFRRAEGLRIGRAQRHQSRLEAFPHLGIGIGFFQVHSCQCWNPLEVGQGRHVHDRETRQVGGRDLDHQNPDGVVGVLRLLHRKADQIVTGDVDVTRRRRIQLSRQVAREDRPVGRFVAQLDAHFGAVAVDQFRGLGAAHQGHVVAGHQQLRCQQRAVRGSENENVARHGLSSPGHHLCRLARRA